jgi:uncharacterized membrane protein YfcA
MGKKDRKKRFVEFNDEMIWGEIGSVLGSALGAYISSSALSENLAPAFSVAGSILGNTVLYLSAKIYHKVRRNEMSLKNLVTDLSYYAPAAVPISIFIGYPSLYFITQFFIEKGLSPLYSGAIGAIFAFLIFLVLINIYRAILFRFFRKRI